MPKSKLSLQLADLELYQAHCELRSDPMYLLWDRAGAVWHEMTEKMPGLTHATVAPNEQVFRLGQQYELKVQLESHGIHASQPHQSLEEFSEIQGNLTRAIERNLEVEHYKRIGLRVMYAREFASKAEATKYLVGRGLVKTSTELCFGVEGDIAQPQNIATVEGKSGGWSARVQVKEEAFSINVPLSWDEPVPEEKTKVRVVLDIDRYETGLLPIGQIDVSDWIKSGAHAIRRDADQMIEEYLAR